ncbi:Dbl homology domain-containing protein [Zopfochytrium polystomum]|nr:Dbl homology domain-containing protein [Zopfochytrium polystomum]
MAVGSLGRGKWFHLSEGEVNLEEASQTGLGSIIVEDGKPYFALDLSAISAEEVKRQEIVYELMTTEREYIRDLSTIIEFFLKPIREQGLITAKYVSVLFSNIEQLLPVNQEFLGRLDQRRRERVGIVDEVGDIFLVVAQYFKMYTIYCGNQPEAMSYLKRERSNKRLSSFLQFCLLKPVCRGLDLGAFLLKPVQRICKYPLLLRELLKHTLEDHVDRKNLEAAFELTNNIVSIVNERRRFVENQHALLSAMSKLDSDVRAVVGRNLHWFTLTRMFFRCVALSRACKNVFVRGKPAEAQRPISYFRSVSTMGGSFQRPIYSCKVQPAEGEISGSQDHSRQFHRD